MKRKQLWKRLTAWVLTGAMVFGNSSFAALAQETTEPAVETVAEAAAEESAAEPVQDAENPQEEGAAEDISEGADSADDFDESADAEILPEDGEDDVEIIDLTAESEAAAEENTEGSAPAGENDENETVEIISEEEIIIGEETEEAVEAAELPELEDDGDSEYSVSIEPEQSFGEGTDMGSWIYLGGSQTFQANTEGLNGLKGFTIEWSLFDSDGNETDAASLAVDKNNSGKVTITANTDVANDTWVDLVLRITKDDEEIARTDMGIVLFQQEYSYTQPLSGPGEDCILPSWSRGLSMYCYVRDNDHIWGEDVDVTITNVEITATGTWDGDTEVTDNQTRADIYGSEEEGWWIEARSIEEDSYGWVKLQYTYTDLKTGEAATCEGMVYIYSDVYEIQTTYRNNSDYMNLNDSMTVETKLWHGYIGEDGHEEEYIEDYTLQINTDEENMYDTERISPEIDGTNVILSSKTLSGYQDVLITAYVNEVAVADTWLGADIVDENGYFMLLPASLTNEDGSDVNPAVGEELDLNDYSLSLWKYTGSGSATQVDVDGEHYRFRLESYDENCWSVKEGTEDNLIPTLIRRNSEGTSVILVAEQNEAEDGEEPNWQTIYYRDYNFSDLDYRPMFAYSYAYSEEPRGDCTLYNGTPLTLTLKEGPDSVAFPDGYTVKWEIEDSENSKASALTLKDLGNGQATLTANPEELENSVCVIAHVYYGDVEFASTENWVYVMDPVYNYDYPMDEPGECDFLPEWTYDISNTMNCYVEDPTHPYGADVEVTITNVAITARGTWDDNGESVTNDTNTFTLEAQDGGWRLTANEWGWAKLQMTYSSVKDGSVQTYDFDAYEYNERYLLDISWNDGYDKMLKNAAKTADVSLTYWYLDEDGYEQSEQMKNFELVLETDENGNPTYDTNYISVDIDNSTETTKKVTITSKSEEWDGTVGLKAIITYEDGTTAEVGHNYLWVAVQDEVLMIEPLTLDENPEMMGELDLNDKLKVYRYYRDANGSEQKEEVSGYTFQLDYDPGDWDVKAGTGTDGSLPVLIRNVYWSMAVGVYALDSDGNTVAWRYYDFDEVKDLELELTYSYDEKDSATGNKTVLTGIPLKVTLNTTPVDSLSQSIIRWYLWNIDADGKMTGEMFYLDSDTSSGNTGAVTAQLSEDGKTLTLQGIEGKEGQSFFVSANVYKDYWVAGGGFYGIVSTCSHNWTRTVTKDATCTEEGIAMLTCSVCGVQKTEAIAAQKHQLTYHSAVAPTCTTNGSEAYYSCSNCNQKFTDADGMTPVSDLTVKAAGHKWSEWKTTTAATVFSAAKQTRTCSNCKNTETRNYGKKLTPTLKVTASSLTMKKGQSTTAFKAYGFAKGDSLKSVVSSNTAVLKVSNVNKKGTFKLTAQKKTGKATLTITLASGKSTKVNVTVQKGKVATTSISGVASKLTLAKGKTATLSPVLTPVTSQDKVTYKSSNKKVVKVSSKGVITAVKAGTATVTVKSGKKSVKVKVTVTGVKTTKITGVPSKKTLKVKKSFKLSPSLTPSNSSEKITYTSSNKNVATVSSSGKVTAKKAGTAVITVKSGSVTVKCTVTVTK